MPRSSIQRSQSLSAISATATSGNESSATSRSKRTRKRFTHNQIVTLEQAFYKFSHPSREERERLAEQTGMDLKSVTIWFQNKRQTERKVALNNSTNRGGVPAPDPLAMYSILHNQLSGATSSFRSHSSQIGHVSSAGLPFTTAIRSRTANSFLSLDRIASRAELPTQSPRTPKKLTRHASYAGSSAVWEDMLSSPIRPDASPCSPFSRDIFDFATKHPNKASKRSLEWACATARISEKSAELQERPRLLSLSEESSTTVSDDTKTDCDDTEMESLSDVHEAVTPNASQDIDLTFVCKADDGVEAKAANEQISPPDVAMKRMTIEEDIMTAAWALCGLSRS